MESIRNGHDEWQTDHRQNHEVEVIAQPELTQYEPGQMKQGSMDKIDAVREQTDAHEPRRAEYARHASRRIRSKLQHRKERSGCRQIMGQPIAASQPQDSQTGQNDQCKSPLGQ